MFDLTGCWLQLWQDLVQHLGQERPSASAFLRKQEEERSETQRSQGKVGISLKLLTAMLIINLCRAKFRLKPTSLIWLSSSPALTAPRDSLTYLTSSFKKESQSMRMTMTVCLSPRNPYSSVHQYSKDDLGRGQRVRPLERPPPTTR